LGEGFDLKQRNCRDCKGSGYITTKHTATLAGRKRIYGRRVPCPCVIVNQFDTDRMKIPTPEKET
jgi:hypothetical protein